MRPGEIVNRLEFARRYRANNSRGITRSGVDDIINVFYGADEVYEDRWKEPRRLMRYAGDGRSGDQELKFGNKLMKEALEANSNIRLFQFQTQGAWLFETWARVVGVNLVTGFGEDGALRQEFEWLISPVIDGVGEPAFHDWRAERDRGLQTLTSV